MTCHSCRRTAVRDEQQQEYIKQSCIDDFSLKKERNNF